MEQFWDNFRKILGQIWDNFRTIFGSFRENFGINSGSFMINVNIKMLTSCLYMYRSFLTVQYIDI